MESKVLGRDDEGQEEEPGVSMDFFKFPHTPQLAWFAAGQPREDKVLNEATRAAFLAGELIVEEKVDGANIGFSVGHNGRLHVQNRGSYLGPASHPQFAPLWPWLAARESAIAAVSFVGKGFFDLDHLRRLLDVQSQVGSGPREGIYLRREEGDWTVDRAKLVRPEFADAIGEHWSHKKLKKNRVDVEILAN